MARAKRFQKRLDIVLLGSLKPELKYSEKY
jgi:hypothetical protein